MQFNLLSVQIGGSLVFNRQGERNHYGNNVTYRMAVMPTGSMRCWVDLEKPLASGIISRYFIYIHNFSSSSIDEQSRRIRLQIWRPVDLAIPRFMLVWEQLVVIDAFPSTGAFYVVCCSIISNLGFNCVRPTMRNTVVTFIRFIEVYN